jgi:flagellin-like hook-associated protein FlgL
VSRLALNLGFQPRLGVNFLLQQREATLQRTSVSPPSDEGQTESTGRSRTAPLLSNLRSLGALTERIVAARRHGLFAPMAVSNRSGRVLAHDLEGRLAAFRAAVGNLSANISLMTAAETVLGQVSDLLKEARTLVETAARPGLPTAELTFLNRRLQQIRDEIDGLAQTTFGNRRLLGRAGIGFAQIVRETFADTTNIANLVSTRLESARIVLDRQVGRLFTDSFTGTDSVDTGLTTAVVGGGQAVSPQQMQQVFAETFSSLTRVALGLTTAVVDTVAGEVRLGLQVHTRRADAFATGALTDTVRTTATLGAGFVRQTVETLALFGDLFETLANVDTGLTTANVAAAPGGGTVQLPSEWVDAFAASPGWTPERELSERWSVPQDGFSSGITESGSTAVITAGAVTAPTVAQTLLWQEAPEVRLPATSTTMTYTSPTQTFGYQVANVSLDPNHTIPTAGGITYFIDSWDGSAWQAQQISTFNQKTQLNTPSDTLRLRAVITGLPAARPTLHDYRVYTHDLVTQGATWTSTSTTLGYDSTRLRLSVTESLNAGDTISYFVSANNGTTWFAATPGEVVTIPEASMGSQLRVRAVFTSTSGYTAGRLRALTLQTFDFESERILESFGASLAEGTSQLRLDPGLTNYSAPAGTSVTFYATNDGGLSWRPFVSDVATFDTAGTDVGLRAVLTSTGTYAPAVSDFVLQRLAYLSGRYLYSQVNTTGQDVTNVRLTVDDETPDGTAIEYWVSTDGGSEWTAVTPGVLTAVPAGRDLLLRALLTSGGVNQTPALRSYQLETDVVGDGEWYSTLIDPGSEVNRLRLTVSEEKPVGTDIQYYLSTDGGTNFDAVTPGSFFAVTPSRNLVLKAVFTSSSTMAEVAQLLEYTLESEDYAPSQVLTWIAGAEDDLGHDLSRALLDVSETLPAGTAITYEVSNDGGTTWVGATPGQETMFASGGSRLAVRATLAGTNLETPLLEGFTLTAPMFTSGVLYSRTIAFSEPVDNFTLDVSQSLPDGSAIAYEYSLDSGATWNSFFPNVRVTLDEEITGFLLRASFTATPDGRQSASLLDWSVDADRQDTAGSMTTRQFRLERPVSTVRLAANEIAGDGTIAYELSVDGGANWRQIRPGQDLDLPGEVSGLMLRATFAREPGGEGPQLAGYALSGDNQATFVTAMLELRTSADDPDPVRVVLPAVSSEALGLDMIDLSDPETAAAGLQRLQEATGVLGLSRDELLLRLEQMALSHELYSFLTSMLGDLSGRINSVEEARESIRRLRSQILYGAEVVPSDLDGRRMHIKELLRRMPPRSLAPKVEEKTRQRPAAEAAAPPAARTGARVGAGLAESRRTDPFGRTALPPLLAPPAPPSLSGTELLRTTRNADGLLQIRLD